MSVHHRPDGTPIVRYRPGGKKGPNRQKTFAVRDYGSLELAEAAAAEFDASFTLKKATGHVGPIAAAEMRLDAFAQEWFRDFAKGSLAPKTQRDYADQWDRHLLPRVGTWTFGKSSRPAVWVRLRLDLEAAGLGDATIAKLLGIVQAMFREAVLWDYVETNPLKEVPKPTPRKRAVLASHPLVFELMRRALLDRQITQAGNGYARKVPAPTAEQDALLASLIHLAGLRPGEALGLEWERVLANTLVIDQAASLGELRPTKNRRNRSVRLLAPLKTDLAVAAAADGRGLVFARPDGKPWTEVDYRNWRGRVWFPTQKAIGLPRAKPYAGRHCFASLLLHHGETVAYVAEQLGDTIDTVQGSYLHVVEELRGVGAVDAEQTIKDARSLVEREGVRKVFATLSTRKADDGAQSQSQSQSPLGDSNPGPPPYHGEGGPTQEYTPGHE